jgi:hypothetical protein
VAANWTARLKAGKAYLMGRMSHLDGIGDEVGMSPNQWQDRYALEHQMMKIYEMEEIY